MKANKEPKSVLVTIKSLVGRHILFIAILFTALVLRLTALGSIPAGLSWDEAAIAYNGYGIVSVHRDEWLQKMPIVFKSFGDYKAPVSIYLDAISTTILGINTFAIRFPMAVAGVFTVFTTYFIAEFLFKKRSASLVAALFIAVSPLNIQFSRIAFESGIGVFLSTLGVLLFLYAVSQKNRAYALLGTAASFAVAIYAYHSTKITVPLLCFCLAAHHRKWLVKNWRWTIAGVLVGAAMLYPLAKETMQGKAGERFYMTSVIMDRNGLLPLNRSLPTVWNNTLAHFRPSFLLMGESSTYRHGTNKFGILSYLEFGLILAALLNVALRWKTATNKSSLLFVALAIFIALVPAVISNDAPHSNRAHGVVPWVQMLAAYGFGVVFSWAEKKKRSKIFISLFLAALIAQTVLYTYWYVTTYTTTPAIQDFQYGYKEAVMYARQKESEVNKVLFTSAYGQPYIYILLYKKLTPIQFHQGALANYEIRDLNWSGDKDKTNVLIVGTPKEIPADAKNIVKEIRYPDGGIIFRIVQQ